MTFSLTESHLLNYELKLPIGKVQKQKSSYSSFLVIQFMQLSLTWVAWKYVEKKLLLYLEHNGITLSLAYNAQEKWRQTMIWERWCHTLHPNYAQKDCKLISSIFLYFPLKTALGEVKITWSTLTSFRYMVITWSTQCTLKKYCSACVFILPSTFLIKSGLPPEVPRSFSNPSPPRLLFQVLRKISGYIQEQNEKIFAPRGLLLTDPIERGMRVVSFSHVLL